MNFPGFGSDHDVSWVLFPWHVRVPEARAVQARRDAVSKHLRRAVEED